MSAALAAAGAGLGLGAGTYVFRFAGATVRRRLGLGARAQRLIELSSVVLLVAVMATAAVADDQRYTGAARPLGVAVALLLAWRRAPTVVVIIAASVATALARIVFG